MKTYEVEASYGDGWISIYAGTEGHCIGYCAGAEAFCALFPRVVRLRIVNRETQDAPKNGKKQKG